MIPWTRAMAAHDADYVEPSTELGKDWLEMEARRNCRWRHSCQSDPFVLLHSVHPVCSVFKSDTWLSGISLLSTVWTTQFCLSRMITSINTCIDELVAFCPDMLKVKEENSPTQVFDLNLYSRSPKAIRKLSTSSRSWLWATRRTEIGTQRNVQAQCKCSKMKQQQQQTSTIINDSQILKTQDIQFQGPEGQKRSGADGLCCGSWKVLCL